ncbi:MAG: Rne/Rng family ribonuclease [SAR324 cluster bacterium]|nr:Rne/Rng family ribonuclease [SAR324 cluster bacterium]
MAKDILIQYIPHEIRVALREDERVQELFVERPDFRNPVGNIYKGRVLKVIPGMESAFINIGLAKAAFLNINDIQVNPALKQDISADITDTDKLSISDILSEGQDIVVQIYKAPISTKGARVSTSVSIAGRNLVFLPDRKGVALSKQISGEKEKARIKKMLTNLKGKDYGLIVRTYGKLTSELAFKKEIDYLTGLWQDIEKKVKRINSPTLLFEEPNIIYRLFRDNLGSDVDKILIDDKEEYSKLKSFLSIYMQEHEHKIMLYEDRQDIFDAYSVSEEMHLAMARKVPLPSGGYLIIDQSEALTAIDVNTGKFVGDSSHAETVLQTNLEASVELMHQIKLRDIGGIIIIDFIDMDKGTHRQKTYQLLKSYVSKDRARIHISAISNMGLVEMTRQRTQDSLNKFMSMECHYCRGSGLLLSYEAIFSNMCRELYHIKRQQPLPDMIYIWTHPDIVDYVRFENSEGFRLLQQKLDTNIKLLVNMNFHIEQYRIIKKDQLKNPARTKLARPNITKENSKSLK